MAGEHKWEYAVWTNIGTGTTDWGRSLATGAGLELLGVLARPAWLLRGTLEMTTSFAQ